MSRPSAPMQELAKRLIAHDAREHGITGRASFPISQELCAPLVALVGSTGFNALVSHALVLASAEVAWLRAVHVNSDGTLNGLSGLDAQIDPDKIMESRVAFVAQLLELHQAFTGEHLTMQLIRDVWPKLELHKPHSEMGVEYEREE